MPAIAKPADQDHDLLDGRYRLLERLDRGGMATVWRAHDVRLSRTVAIKMLHPGPRADQRARARMQVEAQALAGLSHPHIATVYDYGTTGDDGYLVMELVDGVPLGRVLAARGSLPWHAAVTTAAQVAAALAAAHARGAVHRDVSAANVMVTSSGVKLIDFGLCAVEGGHELEPDGSLCGTPAYIAPERLQGRPVSAAADVYALGVLLYRALAGRLPWPASTAEKLMRAQRQWEPQPLDVEGLPVEIAEMCLRCLACDPAARPSAAEIVEALRGPAALDTGDLATLAGVEDAEPRTRIVRWAVATSALRPRLDPRRRRVLAAAGWTAGVLVALLLIWSATAWIPAGDPVPSQAFGAPVPPAAAPATAPSRVPCAVTYLVTADTGSAFTATVSVTNTGMEPLPDGRLTVRLAGDQRLDVARSPGWRQDGTTLTTAAQPSVRYPGGSTQLTLAGRYATGNALPIVFSLDGRPCSATVVGRAPASIVAGAEPRALGKDGSDARPKPGNTKRGTNSKGQGQDQDGDSQ